MDDGPICTKFYSLIQNGGLSVINFGINILVNFFMYEQCLNSSTNILEKFFVMDTHVLAIKSEK